MDERMPPQRNDHEAERIPPELDPVFDELDDGRAHTLANRMRPLIWIAAVLALAGILVYYWP